jgi:hypothetical protein
MTTTLDESSISAEEQAHLQEDVLHLNSPDVSADIGLHLYDAVNTHAAPLVDLLIQLQEGKISRSNPILADFSLTSGGADYMLYTNNWKRQMKRAVRGVAALAGLNVDIGSEAELSEDERQNVAWVLARKPLPPALRRRIDQRNAVAAEDRPVVTSTPEVAKKLRDTLISTIKGLGVDQIVKFTSKVIKKTQQNKSADFRLEVAADIDEKSYVQNHQSSVWLYKQERITISLIQNSSSE